MPGCCAGLTPLDDAGACVDLLLVERVAHCCSIFVLSIDHYNRSQVDE